MKTIRSLTRSAVLLIALIALASTPVQAFDGPATSPEKEKELLAVLGSDAPESEKAIACKNLAIHGSDGAVPALAKLLPDPQLSSWARIALEVIPGQVADEALQSAAKSLEGQLLIGTINSIGVRRDAGAVDLLITRLKDLDAEVASAAAVSLGRIGNEAATKALRRALTTAPANVISAIAEGCVLCAERLYSDGNATAATQIYDEIRTADVPMQRIIEATRGAILARNQNGLPLLLEIFQSADKKLFQLALGTAREFPGSEADKALATELTRSTPDRAALIIQAMADRPETVVLDAVLKAAGQGDKQVRLSAIDALSRVGNDSCLSALLNIAAESDADVSQSAKETLGELPGKNVNSQIVAMLPKSERENYILLLQLIGQRRIDAVPVVVKSLDHSDRAVRSAALIALGETVPLAKLSLLVSQVVSSEFPEDAQVAQQALMAASIRMPDREACATELAIALDRSPTAAKTTIMEILGAVGGTKSLQTLATAAKSSDPELQDAGSRLLGKWNGVAAAPVLLDLAKTAPVAKYRIRALRGYIGLARKFAMPEKQRVEMCQNALNSTRRSAEQKLVLDVLKLHPSVAGLNLALKTMQIAAVKDEATQVALVIAQKVRGKGADISKLLSQSGLGKVKLEIVKAEYGAGETQKDITAVLKKQAGDLPLITLASTSYNASFGGDPSPGVVKQLKVQYLMNGKLGEASFAENALIVLPMPK